MFKREMPLTQALMWRGGGVLGFTPWTIWIFSSRVICIIRLSALWSGGSVEEFGTTVDGAGAAEAVEQEFWHEMPRIAEERQATRRRNVRTGPRRGFIVGNRPACT